MIVMIILLILCLPLILMLSLFTATEVVSIMVDVPVNGIDVEIEELVELDLDRGESFEVDYVVSPTEASNKDVIFRFLALDDEKLADFSVDGNKITPISYGSARVVVETVDGGYRDSFDVIVYSKRVESIASRLDSPTLTVGQTAKIQTSFYPEIVRDEGLSYRVKSGEGIVSVTASGTLKGIGIGTAVIEVASKDNPSATSEITVEVKSSGILDFVSDRCDITALTDIAELYTVINPELTVLDYSLTLLAPDGVEIPEDIAVAHLDTASGVISCQFIDEAFVGDIEIVLHLVTSGGEVTKSAYVHRISEIEIGWADTSSDGRYGVLSSNSDGIRIEINQRPLGADVSYFVSLDYTAFTPVDGNVRSGESFELVSGERYVAESGTLSVELEVTADGVFLVVRGEYEPTPDEINSQLAVTEISVKVVNNHDGSLTVLDKISVVVY